MAARPMLPAASRITPLLAGTGGANRLAEAPSLASFARWCTEPGVGMTARKDCLAACSRFR